MYTIILYDSPVRCFTRAVKGVIFRSALSRPDCVLAVSDPVHRRLRSYRSGVEFVQEYEQFYMGRM